MSVSHTIIVFIISFVTKLSEQTIAVLPTHSITYDDSDYLLNTPGCKIPKFDLKYRSIETLSLSVCGKRRIIVNKLKNNYITFYFIQNLRKCEYRFIYGSRIPKPFVTTQGRWRTLVNGTRAKLKSDFVIVRCGVYYEDVFSIIMKQDVPRKKKAWNVLMLGLDSMSRSRAIQMLPHTVAIMQAMNFLDFRAFTVSSNDSSGNIKGMLSSETLPMIADTCRANPEVCSNLWLWNNFESAGFVTARGDDGVGIDIDDTYSSTHHFLKPIFTAGEQKLGNVYCTATLATGEHVLNYAFDFVENYHRTNRFFGFFWSGRHTSDRTMREDANPRILDAPITLFFQKLWYEGLLNDTFVIFFSNHGLQFGSNMIPVGSHYDSRLPMLYIRPPTRFKEHRYAQYLNIFNNQNRLVTPFDLYLTLWDIMTSFKNPYEVPTHRRCRKCRSLFSDISKFRTCTKVKASPQSCPCHELIEVTDDREVDMILDLIKINQVIRTVTKNIRTMPCTYCAPLMIKTVLRLHKYIDWSSNFTYYEIALYMKPKEIGMEITLVEKQQNFKVVSIRPTTLYDKKRAYCVKNPAERYFCSCMKKEKCAPERLLTSQKT